MEQVLSGAKAEKPKKTDKKSDKKSDKEKSDRKSDKAKKEVSIGCICCGLLVLVMRSLVCLVFFK